MHMKTNFTAKEKILVHLLDYYGKSDSYTLPVALTQEGIADKVGLKQNTVSYAVRNLVEEGSISEETRRIKGKKQKRKAYFLNEEAVSRAEDIKDKMENTEIEVELDGEEKKIKIGEVNAYFHLNLPLTEIIRRVEEGEGFQRKGYEEGRSYKTYLKNLPKPGSEDPSLVEELEDWWDEDEKAATIIGKEGAGKTTVLSQFAERMKSKTNIFYLKLEDWQRKIHLWRFLGRFLKRIGRHRLFSYLEAAEDQNKREIFANLTNDLDSVPSLLLFDDIDKNDELQQLIKDIAGLEDISSMKILVSSEEKEILGSDEEDRTLHVDPTQGLKSALKETYGIDRNERTEDLLDIVIRNHVTEGEFWALAFMSVLREPVKKEVLSNVDEVNINTVNNLLKTPLSNLTSEDKVLIHPSVREVVLEMLDEDEIKDLHETAYRYYSGLKISKDIENVEELYHLANMDDFDLFEERLSELGRTLLSSGYSGPVVDIIEDYKNRKQHSELKPSMEFIMAEAERKMDRSSSALDRYREVLEATDDLEIKIHTHHGVAKIKETEGEYDEAVHEHKKSIEVGEKIEEESKRDRLLGISYLRSGSLWNKKREYGEAKEVLNRAIETLEKDSHSLLTSAYFMLARIEKSMGDLEDSIDHFETGLDHWEELDETYQRVGGLKEIGSLYTILRELDDAEEYLKEAVDTSEKFGYWQLKASALLSLIECYMERGKLDKAIEVSLEAKDILEELDQEEEKALAHSLLSKAYSMKEEEEKAEEELNKAISIFQRLGSSYRLGLAYFSMAKLQERRGDKEKLAENYRKAILSFSGSGASWMAEKAEKEMESIPISM